MKLNISPSLKLTLIVISVSAVAIGVISIINVNVEDIEKQSIAIIMRLLNNINFSI